MATESDVPLLSLVDIFEKQVDETPERVALEFEGETLSYRDLDDRANRLAHFLLKSGVKSNSFVGIFMDRAVELVVGILGVLKAGCAYVPIDLATPKDRLDFLVKDIETPLVLTQSHLISKLRLSKTTKAVCLDARSSPTYFAESKVRLRSKIDLDDTAYMIYTSGSTGKPKGCMNSHRGIVNYLWWTKWHFPLGENSKVLQKTVYSFDVSVAEFFWPLISGATLVMAKPWIHKDPDKLVDAVIKKKITDLRLVPSMLTSFLEEQDINQCQTLRRVIVSGEALPSTTVHSFYKKMPWATLINLYGPTEAAVDCTYWECSPQDARQNVPIGRPIPNNSIYILDENLKRLPDGEYGEIFIGGVQVAKGYWKRPELNEERFLKDPFDPDPKARMYKTGDRGRKREDGAIEYQGRLDFQVKIRGLRVELGEIESVILQSGMVKNVAVIAKDLGEKDAQLAIVAFVVVNDKFLSEKLSAYVASQLPPHMCPFSYVEISSLPTISSGKIDRKALADQFSLKKNYRANDPNTPTEEIVINAWKTVLKAATINRRSNIFEVGGDSLSIIQIVNLLKTQGIDLDIRDIYMNPDVEGLARFIDTPASEKRQNQFALPPVQRVPETADDKAAAYRATDSFAGYLPFMNHLEGALDVEALKRAICKLIERQWSLRVRLIDDRLEPSDFYLDDVFVEKDLQSLHNDEDKVGAEILSFFGSLQEDGRTAPYRFALFRVSENEHYFGYAIEHAIFDGVSNSVLKNELQELYAAEVEGREPHLPQGDVEFKDFLHWKTHLINHVGYRRRLEFWDGYLNETSPVDYSKIKSKPKLQKGNVIQHELNSEISKKIFEYAADARTTPSCVFLSAFVELLRELTGQKVFTFSVLNVFRPPEISNLMGCSVSCSPFTVKESEMEGGVLDYVTRSLQEIQNSAIADYDLDLVFKNKKIDRLPVLKTQFNCVPHDHRSPLVLKGIESTIVDIEMKSSNWVDLNFVVEPTSLATGCTLDYNRGLFTAKAAEGLLRRYETILRELIAPIKPQSAKAG